MESLNNFIKSLLESHFTFIYNVDFDEDYYQYVILNDGSGTGIVVFMFDKDGSYIRVDYSSEYKNIGEFVSDHSVKGSN